MSLPNPQDEVGTVAQEAARLLEVLSAGGLWAGGPPAEGATTDPGPGTTEASDPAEPDADVPTDSDAASGGDAATDAEPAACHHPPMGEATVCALCPVCQGIALVRSLQPEALDALANLATAAARTLRDLAATAAQDAAAPRTPAPAPAGRTAVVDIEVVDGPVAGREAGHPDRQASGIPEQGPRTRG